MYPILQHPDLPQSFVAAVAALCVEAARRNATRIEIDFADGMVVRDDGEAYGERSQWWIREIGTGRAKAIDYSSKWPLGLYAGLLHARLVEVSSWPGLTEPWHADAVTFDRDRPQADPRWKQRTIPGAPNTPPAHGVAVAWKPLDEDARTPELFYQLKRELRGQVGDEVANLVCLRIPALHGVRTLD